MIRHAYLPTLEDALAFAARLRSSGYRATNTGNFPPEGWRVDTDAPADVLETELAANG